MTSIEPIQPIEPCLFQQPWPEGEFRLFQLGFVVDDLVLAARRWALVHGVGPFHVLPSMEAPCTYRGAQSAIEIQVAVAQAGPVQIELIKQHCDRPSVYTEVFAKHEAGFHQLCTVTPDYDSKQRHYEQLGYELASEIGGKGQRVGYFDTIEDFGFYTEVVEEAPRLLARLATIAQTCAEWDGHDPVRLITRDGYRTPEAL
jgi:Glyoxalase/Bleomycin resistance protein/Dioxygenase superfamily